MEDKNIKNVLEEQAYARIKELANKIAENILDIQKGKSEAFEDLYNNTEEYVFNIVKRVGVESEDTIKDLMQEIYISIYSHLNELDDPKTGMKWIRTIARNKTLDYYKKGAVKHEQLTKEDEDTVFEKEDEMHAAFPVPEDVFDNKETRKIVREVLNELPDLEREILMAYYFDERKVNEIAELFEMPVSTVKTKLSRTRNLLKTKFETLEKEQGIRLHSVGIIPFLLCFFQLEAEEMAVPQTIHNAVVATVLSKEAVKKWSIAKGVSKWAKMKSVAAKYVTKKTTAIALSVVVAGTGVGTIYHSQQSKSPEATLKQLVKSYNEQNVNEMKECVKNPEVFAQVNSEMEENELLDYVLALDIEEDTAEIRVDVTQTQYENDDMANVFYEITYISTSDVWTMEDKVCEMTKKDGKWYVISASTFSFVDMGEVIGESTGNDSSTEKVDEVQNAVYENTYVEVILEDGTVIPSDTDYVIPYSELIKGSFHIYVDEDAAGCYFAEVLSAVPLADDDGKEVIGGDDYYYALCDVIAISERLNDGDEKIAEIDNDGWSNRFENDTDLPILRWYRDSEKDVSMYYYYGIDLENIDADGEFEGKNSYFNWKIDPTK